MNNPLERQTELRAMRKKDLQLRWLIRGDIQDVLGIDLRCFDNYWMVEDFLEILQQRNCIGVVAVHQGEILGFMIYQLQKNHLVILRLAVDPDWYLHGIGSAMVNKLKSKLSQTRRTEIILDIREDNLGGQLFFQKQGFRARHILRDHFDDADAYRMAYSFNAWANRITNY